jgi:hypothetical protein
LKIVDFIKALNLTYANADSVCLTVTARTICEEKGELAPRNLKDAECQVFYALARVSD